MREEDKIKSRKQEVKKGREGKKKRTALRTDGIEWRRGIIER